MDRVSSKKGTDSFALAVSMTALVLVVPCLAAVGLKAAGLVTSPVLLVLIPVLVSIILSHALSEFWKRRRAGSALLFEDLMLWGWLRRRRFERLLSRADEFVGPGADRGLTPEQRGRELERLVSALEARDPRTHGHSKRVARHATSIARSLRLPEEEVARIRTGALLHDVGKIVVPQEILEKPATLTEEEFAQVKKHPLAGSRMVEEMGDPELTAIVRHHHERIDGDGYPDGLVRGQIPMGARIIAVADTFDALTSARTYRSPRSHEEALAVLREEAGTQLDARAVRVFDGRYSSHRPVALVAALLGLGRQAGQSLISFGTGASQVAAVGAAAAVIGTAPAIENEIQKRTTEKPPVVREAEPTGSLAATADATVAEGSGTASAGRRSGTGSGRTKTASGTVDRSPDGTGSPDGKAADPDAPGGSGGPGNGGGSGDPGDGGGGSGGPVGGGNAPGGSGGPTTSPGNDPVRTVTETVQKPLQQVTEQVTEAIPTLPGKDPVSQSVNNTVGGVKDTLGKLTGKP